MAASTLLSRRNNKTAWRDISVLFSGVNSNIHGIAGGNWQRSEKTWRQNSRRSVAYGGGISARVMK